MSKYTIRQAKQSGGKATISRVATAAALMRRVLLRWSASRIP
jgi:hypothetical protein